MIKTDYDKLKSLLIGSASALGQYLAPESVPLWFKDLQQFDFDEIDSAFDTFRKDPLGNMPTPGQVIHLISNRKKKNPYLIETPIQKEEFTKEFWDEIHRNIHRNFNAVAPSPEVKLLAFNDDADPETLKMINEIMDKK